MIEAVVTRLVGLCAGRPWATILVSILVTSAAGFYAFGHLKMDTNTASMIADDLAWKKEFIRFGELFPRDNGLLVVVVDGKTPDLAEDGAAKLAGALAGRPDLFASVRRADGGAYFDRYGLMLLPIEDLRRIAQSIIRAQPFIASLAADPSARGLFEVLSLALTGIASGSGDLSRLETPLAAIANAMSSAFAGETTPMSWRALMIDQPIDPRELRKLILTQPIRDFQSLRPGAKASQFIRDTARELALSPENGVTIRLTGIVALNDEEFATLAEGMGWALFVSAALVLGLLFLALRGLKPVLAAYITLAIGLILTLCFAALTVGSLNLISVAFAVMFIGLSIDFSIQFAVRFAQERFTAGGEGAMGRTATAIARPLTLAAIAIAGGFLSFIPTEYRGVSELGMIAGAGMAITLILNLSLLPALLQLLRPGGRALDMGYAWARRPDLFFQNQRLPVISAWAIASLAGAFALGGISFDFNPLHLKDPEAESVATLRDMMRDPLRAPYGVEIVMESIDAAEAMARRLRELPEIHDAISVHRFVPADQGEKLAIIADLADLVGFSLEPLEVAPPPDAEQVRAALAETASKLRDIARDSDVARQLARLLDQAARTQDDFQSILDHVLVSSLPGRLEQLKAALGAGPLDVNTLPPEIREDWVAKGGEARIAVFAEGDSDDNAVLEQFVTAVRTLAPHATGPGVQILESGRAVAHAFRTASWLALGAMAALLFLVLRRPKDVALVLAPLLAAALTTSLLCRLAGLALNFANVIALPLMLGIGVAFNIYFVINWRAGISLPLQTSTARAILFSALTTAASFGSLAASSHVGTSGMGLLLLLGLGVTLATTFTLLPALLGPVPTRVKPGSA